MTSVAGAPSVTEAERAAAASSNPSAIEALVDILRIRPFRRLWIVLGLASLGDWLGLLATSLFAQQQVHGTTAKGLAFGGVIAIRLLPALLLGPWAGVFADRFDRRLTMVTVDLVRFVLLASIPASVLFTNDTAAIVTWTTVATFLVEAVTLVWLPAKDASLPNLLPRTKLETANQLSLATTYGITPVFAALLLAAMTTGLERFDAHTFLEPTTFSLYFLSFTRLVAAAVVFFGIREIGGKGDRAGAHGPGMLRQFIDGWAYVGKTPLVRGLVFGILAAFAGGGMVVGCAQLYAQSLSGGQSAFAILFAMIFIGLGIGITAGPRLIGALSRRRWFGLSIMLAGTGLALMAFAWHLAVAVALVLLVGVGAGMAFLSGYTLLGAEVADDLRGRVFGFVNMSTRVVLMLAISLASIVVGLTSDLSFPFLSMHIHISSTRFLLFGAGVVAAVAGMTALRQMDDKPGVPVWADLWGSLRGRPLSVPEVTPRLGLFVAFEGGEGAGKSTQVRLLAAALEDRGYDVVVTREPGATDVGQRIRRLLLDPRGHAEGEPLTPRAEALLYAADRAHHVANVLRPALAKGNVVITDRYVDSSLAYQGAGRTLPVEEISWLSNWATGGLLPDLVVLLDVDPAVGLARVAERGASDRLEAEHDAFHERVRHAFLDLAARDPRRYLVVDAAGDGDDIARQVLARVESLISAIQPRTSHHSPSVDRAQQSTVDELMVDAPRRTM